MSEIGNSEVPKILIANKHASIDSLKRGEGIESGFTDTRPEIKKAEPRSFSVIQEELKSLIDNPDKQKEEELIFERARIISEAKDAGVLAHARDLFTEIQTKFPFHESVKEIGKIDIGRIKLEAKSLSRWDNRFEGLLEAYKGGVIRNMELAALNAAGKSGTKRAKYLEREKDLLGWGNPPQNLERLIENPSNTPLNAKEFAKEFAKASGRISPEATLENFLKAEGFGLEFSIGPGTEPGFYVLYPEKDLDYVGKLWNARSFLSTMAAHKYSCASGKDIFEKGQFFGVEINKQRLKVVFELEGAIPVTSIYTAIITNRDYVFEKDKEYKDRKEAVPEGLRQDLLCSVDFINNLKISKGEKDRLIEERENLMKLCPNCVWNANQETFSALRESVRFWLKTKGRNLLFKDEKEEASLIAEGKDIEEIVKARARDAEQTSWNLIYCTGLIEGYNSREHFGDKRKLSLKLPPSNFMNLAYLTLFHPQERFEDKVLDRESGDIKEEWGSFGTWATYNISKNRWAEKSFGIVPKKEGEVTVPRIFSKDTLIPDAFHWDAGVKEHFFDFFYDAGSRFLKQDRVGENSSQVKERFFGKDNSNWNTIKSAPFVQYWSDGYRWGNTIVEVFKKGSGAQRDVDLKDLSEACRNLNIPPSDREFLLMTYMEGINPKKRGIEPAGGMGDWEGHAAMSLKRYEPNFYDYKKEYLPKLQEAKKNYKNWLKKKDDDTKIRPSLSENEFLRYSWNWPGIK